MTLKMPHIAVISGLVAAGIALTFQIIAVAASEWVKGLDVHIGLWKQCNCIDIPAEYVKDWLKATRAFAVLALFFIACTLVVGGLRMFIENKFLPVIACGLSYIAALCVLISFAVFAAKFKSYYGQTTDLSYCFALTVVAFALCFGSGVCFIISKRLGRSSS